MNVWAIDKAQPLKLLLLRWLHQFGENSLGLSLAEQHFQAIEVFALNNQQLRAYIYCFGQDHDCYGIDLIYPLTAHNIIGKYENQSLDQTLAILETHFF